MPTVFEAISDDFYTAFFTPDPEERRKAIDEWIKDSTPIIQSAVENDLRAYLEPILADTWEEKGWKSRAEKFFGRSIRVGISDELTFIEANKLALDITIRKKSSSKDLTADPLIPEVRGKTIEAIDKAKTAIAKIYKPNPVPMREVDLHPNPTVEEAIPIVEKFLKDAYRDNVRRVRIIHGKGEGVLRDAVRESLDRHPFVISISIVFADEKNGGEGAT
ncbi:Smr/MutS family protein, partial [Chloroflexota bacterium]